MTTLPGLPPTTLALSETATRVELTVEDGWDVYGTPHGGYLAAIVARAVLAATQAPDLFTLTVHFLRKAAVGPITIRVEEVGGSRRFTSLQATATQDGQPVMTALASVGDRSTLGGPSWHAEEPWTPSEGELGPRADEAEGFQLPSIAWRLNMRLANARFLQGETVADEPATIRALLEVEDPDQLTALIACDATPPAAWNALGAQGWVPTVELTAHLRARPAPGPLRVTASTRHLQTGFLEEDATVYDSSGTLVVQSRQLARWTA